MKKILILLVIAALTGTFALYAQSEPAELETQTRALNNSALGLGEEKALHKISEQLGVSYELLTQQRQQTNLGLGELLIANSLASSLQANAPDKTFEALVLEHQAGKGWGEIAKENGANLGKVVSQVKRANKAIANEQKNQNRNAEAKRADAGSGTGSGAQSGKAYQNAGRHGSGSAGHGRK